VIVDYRSAARWRFPSRKNPFGEDFPLSLSGQKHRTSRSLLFFPFVEALSRNASAHKPDLPWAFAATVLYDDQSHAAQGNYSCSPTPDYLYKCFLLGLVLPLDDTQCRPSHPLMVDDHDALSRASIWGARRRNPRRRMAEPGPKNVGLLLARAGRVG